MATHSSPLVWKIPWMEEPGRLRSMRSLKVGHDWATSLPLFTFMHWRRKWQPTSVLAWRIPEMGEPGGLPSMVSHRVRHDWSDLAVAAVHSVAPVYLSTFLLFLFQSKRTNCLVITHAFSFVPLAMSFHLCLSFISIFLLFSVLFKNVPY